MRTLLLQALATVAIVQNPPGRGYDLNFLGPPTGEVRGTFLPRTRVNKAQYRVWGTRSMCPGDRLPLRARRRREKEAKLRLLNGIHHLTFVTSDMDRLIAFYERVFR